jgi:hypothetical protein
LTVENSITQEPTRLSLTSTIFNFIKPSRGLKKPDNFPKVSCDMKFSLPVLSVLASAGLASAGIPVLSKYKALYDLCKSAGPNAVRTHGIVSLCDV